MRKPDTIRRALVLIVVAGLIASSSSSAQDPDHADDGGRRAGGPRDHCLDLDPRGHANGLKKHCEPKPSSGGVARGDFNGDGFGDLAVGVPGESVGAATGAGAVNVIYGSAEGLTNTDPEIPAAQFWNQTVVPGFAAESNDAFGTALASGDFNADGFSDLAVGVPGEVSSLAPGTGSVQILRGSPIGLISAGSQVFFSNLFSNASDPTLTASRFGDSLVWADFNGDGFGDLAIEVHANNATTFTASVVVLFGSAGGLQPTGRQQMNFPSAAIGGETPFFAHVVVAAGDFNGDTRADLVVGIPFQDLGGVTDTGMVTVVRGAATGLVTQSPQFISQTSLGTASEADDNFGAALASGDFDGDGFTDLAVGTPGEDFPNASGVSQVNAGAVSVLAGSATGLIVGTSLFDFFTQDSPGMPGGVEMGDGFGSALAAGDFNGDTFKDLAVGVPGEDLAGGGDAGGVNVIYGSATGLEGSAGPGAQFWSQGTSGVGGAAEASDRFGTSLTAWNFGRGGRTDLAIGVPFEDIADPVLFVNRANAGMVNVIYGSVAGLTASGSQTWHQGKDGVPGVLEANDRFGAAVY
jgi:hypothetical protein